MADAYIREDVKSFLLDDPVRRAWAMQGEIVRDVAGRQTLRVELGGGAYYLKRHQGVGLTEILKNWLVGKRPILGARNEYEACRHLEARGLTAPRVAAFAEDDAPAPTRASFVLTDELADFEDLIFNVVKLLEVNVDQRRKYRKQFRHIFVDEYQDLNYGQYRLVKLMTKKGRNLFAIGDPDQTIYGFRGSSAMYSYAAMWMFEENRSGDYSSSVTFSTSWTVV